MAGLIDGVRESAIRSMWTDVCKVTVKRRVTDSTTHISSFEDEILLQNEPCKLSFSSTVPVSGNETQGITQTVKLFLSKTVPVPAGSRVEVKRGTTTLYYMSSGEPNLYTYHQELSLSTAKERA